MNNNENFFLIFGARIFVSRVGKEPGVWKRHHFDFERRAKKEFCKLFTMSDTVSFRCKTFEVCDDRIKLGSPFRTSVKPPAPAGIESEIAAVVVLQCLELRKSFSAKQPKL